MYQNDLRSWVFFPTRSKAQKKKELVSEANAIKQTNEQGILYSQLSQEYM